MDDLERDAVLRDKDLAWELHRVQPTHPRIPELAQSVLAREPSFTGMIILLAIHRLECGDVDEARRLLRDLIGRRDRQYVNALKELRDLEYEAGDYAESLRLADLVLRESPEVRWQDLMERGVVLALTTDPEGGWQVLDDAVELCARVDAGRFGDALGWRATRLFNSGAPPERFLAAAEAAIEADPTDMLITANLGFAYLYSYRPDDALHLFRRVLSEDPTDPVAALGFRIARGFLDQIERGAATLEDHRRVGTGEATWRRLRELVFGGGLDAALAALDAVMPEDLARSLRPPLHAEAAAKLASSEEALLSWHDGQPPGTGALWGAPGDFRIMTGAEITQMDDAIEQEPHAWPQWTDARSPQVQLFTDDAGSYLIEGYGMRLYRRGPEGTPDVEVAPSLADWVWDRVASFGGRDPRPGRH